MVDLFHVDDGEEFLDPIEPFSLIDIVNLPEILYSPLTSEEANSQNIFEGGGSDNSTLNELIEGESQVPLGSVLEILDQHDMSPVTNPTIEDLYELNVENLLLLSTITGPILQNILEEFGCDTVTANDLIEGEDRIRLGSVLEMLDKNNIDTSAVRNATLADVESELRGEWDKWIEMAKQAWAYMTEQLWQVPWPPNRVQLVALVITLWLIKKITTV